LFDRPKPTVGCSANGRKRRRIRRRLHKFLYVPNFKFNFTLIKCYMISCKDFNCILPWCW
jgi:hypothetical protein